MATHGEQYPKSTAESVIVRVPSLPPLPLPPPPPQQQNFLRSAPPARFMYFARDGSWQDFSGEVAESLGRGLVDRKPMVEVSYREGEGSEARRYLFDLKRMLQIDFESGSQRSIAWIDETGKCFFPKRFVSEGFGDVDDDENNNSNNNNSAFQGPGSDNRKIEIEIKIDGGRISQIKRKREGTDGEEPEVSSSLKVKGEDGAKRQRLVSKWANARLMSEDERRYQLIRDKFLQGMRKVDPTVVITAIHHCTREGDFGRAREEVFQRQLGVVKKARGTVNLAAAWYGAPRSDVQHVLLRGFGMPGQVLGGDSYGVGVQLSHLDFPQLSAKLADVDDNGEKHLILCRAILGKLEKVEAGSKQSFPSSEDFDTGADDPKDPKSLVVWYSKMNMHLIPEGVVSFKSASHVQGQARGLACAKYYSFEKLFSKIRDSLPHTKVREVLTLYGTYRAREVAKDDFLKQLRGLVGDELLLSTLRQIRSIG
ncbi:hypothetical protein Tsubulata_022695 [Turnera subulata]|uniref:Poly [ADP-ribose] polymerase n=1 Tax=Turnera subulata TaxID=218843 RepID=A0A9Q0F923_9ROSI|nr:hypothetical protein Tsubulata_022695 [Turnera subulata]